MLRAPLDLRRGLDEDALLARLCHEREQQAHEQPEHRDPPPSLEDPQVVERSHLELRSPGRPPPSIEVPVCPRRPDGRSRSVAVLAAPHHRHTRPTTARKAPKIGEFARYAPTRRIRVRALREAGHRAVGRRVPSAARSRAPGRDGPRRHPALRARRTRPDPMQTAARDASSRTTGRAPVGWVAGDRRDRARRAARDRGARLTHSGSPGATTGPTSSPSSAGWAPAACRSTTGCR